MRYFWLDSLDKESSQRAGGHLEILPLHENDSDLRAAPGSDSELDRELSLHIHRLVMNKLAPDPALRPYLFQKDSDEGWDGIAAAMGKTSVALRKEVSRLRRRHWESFRDEVAELAMPEFAAAETQYLYELLFKNPPAD